jgi:mannose-6-phosphate isomerase-like protein (cupin superfamily)
VGVVDGVIVTVGDAEVITDRAERTVRIVCAHVLMDATWSRYEHGEEGPEPHVHHEHVDSFFVLEGELVFELGASGRARRVAAGRGTWISVPQEVVHTFRNEGDARAVFLNFHTPSGGFAASLRGDGDSFDSDDPPESGGRDPGEAIVVPPGGGERVDRGDRVLVIMAALPELSALDSSFEFGWEGVDPHVHRDHLDSFFVLEGDGDFLRGDETHRAGEGTFIALPPGVRHGFTNPGPETLRVLNVHAPDGGFAAGVRGS